jgi:O-glycosyl hydrolase
MKTIITLLTTTMLVAGATNAMAFDRQATDDALGYAISQQQAAHGFGGAQASARVPGRAHASARVPRGAYASARVRNSTVNVPSQEDFQLVGNH